MLKKLIMLAGALVFTLLLAACSPAPQSVSVDASHSGETVNVASGASVIVTLDSNDTTGYEWRLAEDVDEDVLRLANSEYIAPETTLVGAGGQEVWTFEAVGAGETTISLEYVRPWEEGVPAVDTFQLTVVVE